MEKYLCQNCQIHGKDYKEQTLLLANSDSVVVVTDTTVDGKYDLLSKSSRHPIWGQKGGLINARSLGCGPISETRETGSWLKDGNAF